LIYFYGSIESIHTLLYLSKCDGDDGVGRSFEEGCSMLFLLPWGQYSASLLEERVRARALEDQLLGEAVENPEFFSRKGRDLKKYPKMWIELICN